MVYSFDEIKKEYDSLLNQLSDPELSSNWEKLEELSKRKKTLEKIIDKQKEIDETKRQIEENKSILKAGDDKDLISLAEIETIHFQEKERILEKEIDALSKEKENKSSLRTDSIIIEIRAGTGGDEAALFAGDLFKMYSKYACSREWRQKVLDSHPTGIGGFKEIIFEIKGEGTYFQMKNEGGVHRVQRIPKTEKAGRIHTSTASVAVLLKPKPTDIKIKPEEIRIDYYRSSGAGGQNVQKRETAVRITHLKTGIVVTSQNERSQLQNRENALAILAARILEKKQSEEGAKISGTRKTQIGKAKRVEKIRTYNFPQDRITDHRIKKSWHNIEEIMGGKLDKIIETLAKTEE